MYTTLITTFTDDQKRIELIKSLVQLHVNTPTKLTFESSADANYSKQIEWKS